MFKRFLERITASFRTPCPSCGARTLRMRNWIRATCVDDQGRRYPDSWTYESCETCQSRFKRYIRGRIETPSEAEWKHYVSDPESKART